MYFYFDIFNFMELGSAEVGQVGLGHGKAKIDLTGLRHR